MPLLEYSTKRQSFLLDSKAPTNNSSYDALVASATAYGDAAQVPGKLLDLSYLVVNDPVVDWQDIPAGLRASMSMYDGKIVALPLALAAFLMYYRLDIFQRDNLTVPQTWEQFADLAERYHNGPDGLVGACVMPIGCRGESLMLRTIYASYVQTHGHSQGVYWDPETMQPLVNSPAMGQALRIFRRLYAVGLKTSHAPTCLMPEFNQGKCLLSISPGSRFKEANIGGPNVTVLRGRIGFAPIPGSTRVLDRRSMTLVRCDKQRCPLAEGQAEEDGVMVPLNRPSTVASAIILINGLSPLQYQFFAYQLFALLTASRITDTQTVLLEDNDQLPLRLQELSTDYLQLWVKRGYNAEDTTRFLTVYKGVMASDNVSPDLKIRLTSNVTSALLAAALQFNDQRTPESTLPAILARLQSVLDGIVAAESSPEAFAQQYRRSLNWAPSNPNAPDYASSQQPPPVSGGGDSKERGTTLAVALSVSCGLLLVLVAVGAFLLRRRLRLQRAAPSNAAGVPPGVGELTTLVVSDIFESTMLWEYLPATVMDAALSTHHDIMRETRVKFKGFESATEGDSFIIGFKCPASAVAFCLRVQQALLDASWPAELLSFTLPNPPSIAQQQLAPTAVAVAAGGGSSWTFSGEAALAQQGQQGQAAPAGIVFVLPPSRGPRQSDGSSLFMSSMAFEDDGASLVSSAAPQATQQHSHSVPGVEQLQKQQQMLLTTQHVSAAFAASPAPLSPQWVLSAQRPAAASLPYSNTAAAASVQSPAAAGAMQSGEVVATGGGVARSSSLATPAAITAADYRLSVQQQAAESGAGGAQQGAEPHSLSPAQQRHAMAAAWPPPPPAPMPPAPAPPPQQLPLTAAQAGPSGAGSSSSGGGTQQMPEQLQTQQGQGLSLQLGRPPTFEDLYPHLEEPGSSFTAASPAATASPVAGALTAPGFCAAPGAIYMVAEDVPTQETGARSYSSAHSGCSGDVASGLLLHVPPSDASPTVWLAAGVASPTVVGRGAAAAAAAVEFGSGPAAGNSQQARLLRPPGEEAPMAFLPQSLATGDMQQQLSQQVMQADTAAGASIELAAAAGSISAGARLPPSLATHRGELTLGRAGGASDPASGLQRPAPPVPPLDTAATSQRASSSPQPLAGTRSTSSNQGALPAGASCSRSRPASGFAGSSGEYGAAAPGERWSPGSVLAGMMSKSQRASHGQQHPQHQQHLVEPASQTLGPLRTSNQRAATTTSSCSVLRSSDAAARLLAGAAARGPSGAVSHLTTDGAGRLSSGVSPNALIPSMGLPSGSQHGTRAAGSEVWRPQHSPGQPPQSAGPPLRTLLHNMRVPAPEVGGNGGSLGSLGSVEVLAARQQYALHQQYLLQQSPRPPSGGPLFSGRRLPIKTPSAAFLGSAALGNAMGKTRKALRRTSSAAKLVIRTAAGGTGHAQAQGAGEAVLAQGAAPRANTGAGFVLGAPQAVLPQPLASGIGSPKRSLSLSGMAGAAVGGGVGGPVSTSSIRQRVSGPGGARVAASLMGGSAAGGGGGGVEAAVSVAAGADAVTFGELLRLQWCVPSSVAPAPGGLRRNSMQQQRRRSISEAPGGAAAVPPVKQTADVSLVSTFTDDMLNRAAAAGMDPGWTGDCTSPSAVDGGGAEVRMLSHLTSPQSSFDRQRESVPALTAPSQKVLHSLPRPPAAATQRSQGAASNAVTVFRGLRVRIGVHSQITTATDLTRNDACGRVQYSGALLRLAKAVSDVGQGGMILMSQATRDALQQATEGESAAALQKALGGPFVILWMGRHMFADGAGDAHLYQVVSMPLIGRLAWQLQQPGRTLLRKCSPVPPFGGGVLDAPASGLGTLARISVVGASTLMAWNAEVTSRALAQMHEMLLAHLSRCLNTSCDAVVEEEDPSGASGGVRVHAAGSDAACYVVEGAEGLLGFGKSQGRGGRIGITAKQRSIFTAVGFRTSKKEAPQQLAPQHSGPSSSGRHTRATPSLSGTAEGANAGGGSGNTLTGHDARSPSHTAHSACGPAWLHKANQQQPRTSLTAAVRQKLQAQLATNSSTSAGAGSTATATGVTSAVAPRADLASPVPAAAAVTATAAAAGPSSCTKLLPKHSAPGAMTVAWRGAASEAVHWLLSCLASLPHMDWPEELLEHPLAEEALFEGLEGQQQALHWRGLRATGVVAWGELAGCLEPGSLSGHMSYQQSPAWQSLKRVTAASQIGKVVVSADVAAMLPPEQLDHVVVAQQGATLRKTKRG
ncbi:hypothetical protein HYH02_008264 [Chlamydomonas schloesseri]|uniref:Guanylate cyclase domain-containing protein n=1 Tax=Chlamydomonas schloesseri TaxID=2026947 RepID=A0A835WFV2_9CHLO|nr:hypothetical protein HYH02_008264 [Chlamydomonas schloesseri]|eukprot:KAG2446698.1 hypothetical protein HYH02_008264 [Chlamydomonas schloesseri]